MSISPCPRDHRYMMTLTFRGRKLFFTLLAFCIVLMIVSILFLGFTLFFIFITIFVLILVVGMCRAYKKKEEGEDDQDMEDISDIEELRNMSLIICTFDQLKKATNEFRESLGAGGFGTVHRGSLENGQDIAVKCLRCSEQGNKEFLAEVRTIGSIHHINLVKLVGYCPEKAHRALVYEFMPNGSLEKWIFLGQRERSPLSWLQRKMIILGIAKGLEYLHDGCAQKIAHLDIKPQNILLDGKFQAKISDFGLSRLIDRDQSQVLTRAGGTAGYIAPEVYRRATISVKADVYSYGVVIAEIVCGRKNLGHGQETADLVSVLMTEAKEDEGVLVSLIDPNNDDMQLHRVEATRLLKLAIWCLQLDPSFRPPMSTVIMVLEGNIDIPMDLDRRMEIAAAMSVDASVLSAPR